MTDLELRRLERGAHDDPAQRPRLERARRRAGPASELLWTVAEAERVGRALERAAGDARAALLDELDALFERVPALLFAELPALEHVWLRGLPGDDGAPTRLLAASGTAQHGLELERLVAPFAPMLERRRGALWLVLRRRADGSVSVGPGPR